jgi:(R)-amidase
MSISDHRNVTKLVFASIVSSLIVPFNLLAVERDVVISAYQGPCHDGNFAANLAAAHRVVKEAQSRGSNFLVFPETFLSGYDTPQHVKQGARSIDDPELKVFIEQTAGHDLVILVGLARLTEAGIYNSVLVIHRGKLLGIYDKVMLTGGDREGLGFLPGKALPVFEAHKVRFAVIICHDSSFPQPALMARLQGAEILFTPHYNRIRRQTMDDHRKWVRNCHIGLACQMKMVVARSNVVVTDKKNELGYGDSFIVSPQGEMLAEAELFRTELITARITPAMFKHPYVWARLDEVPAWMKARLADLLVAGQAP